jgi:hypothetical protein
MCYDGLARERVRQIGKLSVGLVGTTCGDVYQGHVMAADSADGIDYRTYIHTHTHTHTYTRKRQLLAKINFSASLEGPGKQVSHAHLKRY